MSISELEEIIEDIEDSLASLVEIVQRGKPVSSKRLSTGRHMQSRKLHVMSRSMKLLAEKIAELEFDASNGG